MAVRTSSGSGAFTTHLKRPRYSIPLILTLLALAALAYLYTTSYARQAHALDQAQTLYEAKRASLLAAGQRIKLIAANQSLKEQTSDVRRQAMSSCEVFSFDRILQDATAKQNLDLVSGAAQDTVFTEAKSLRFEHQRRTLSLKGSYAQTANFIADLNQSDQGLIAVRRLRMNLIAKGIYEQAGRGQEGATSQVATSLALSRFCQTPVSSARSNQ